MAIKKEIEIVVTETGLDEIDKKMENLESSLGGVSDSTKKLNKGLEDTKSKGNVFGSATQGVEALGGGLGGAVSGFKDVIKQMWALVANPVGLVIAAIAGALMLLYKAFASTNDGADKMEQVFAGLGAVLDILRDRFLTMAKAIYDGVKGIVKIMTGDLKGGMDSFSKAMEGGKKAVSGFGAEMEKEFAQAMKAAAMLQEVEDAVRKLGVSRAKLNRDLARSKELITDETASYAEKKKAIDEVRIAEEKQTAQELAAARKKVEAIKLQNSLSDVSDENFQKLADAQEALYALEEKSASDRRAIRKTEIRIQKEEQDRLDAIAQEREEKRKAQYEKEKAQLEDALQAEGLSFEKRREMVNTQMKLTAEDKKKLLDQINKEEKKAIEDHNKAIADLNKRYDEEKENRLADTETKKAELDYQRRKAEIESIAQTELEKQTLIEKLEEEHQARLLEIAKKENEKKKELDEADAKRKKALAKAEQEYKIETAMNVLSALGSLAKSGSKLAKGVAVSQAVISTYQGINKALAETTDFTPSQTLRFINAGAVGVAGFANVAKILSTQDNGSGASGGSSVATPAAPSFNLVQGTGSNQIAQSIGKQAPLKAFVVAKDVTTGQSLDRNIIESASL